MSDTEPGDGYNWMTPTLVDPAKVNPVPIGMLGDSVVVELDSRVLVVVDRNGKVGPMVDGEHWARNNGGYVIDIADRVAAQKAVEAAKASLAAKGAS